MLFPFYLYFSSVCSKHFSVNFIPQCPHLLENILFVRLRQCLQKNIHQANKNNNLLLGLEVLCLLVYQGSILNGLFLRLNNLKDFLRFLQMLCLKCFNFFYQISSFFYFDLINHLSLFIRLIYFLFFIQQVSSFLLSAILLKIICFHYLHLKLQVIFQMVLTLSFLKLQLMQTEYRYSFVANQLIIFFNFE